MTNEEMEIRIQMLESMLGTLVEMRRESQQILAQLKQEEVQMETQSNLIAESLEELRNQ